MKRSKLILSLGVFLFGLAIQSFAQVMLPEVNVIAVNYKYLNAADTKDAVLPIKRLEQEAAVFNVKNSAFYEDEYDTYFVSFYIPEGNVLAAYDKDGKLLRTVEKFKNVAIPVAVRQSVAKRFPQWSISKDVYLVNYHDSRGVTKRYKLLLENGDKRIKVKVDEKGDFI